MKENISVFHVRLDITVKMQNSISQRSVGVGTSVGLELVHPMIQACYAQQDFTAQMVLLYRLSAKMAHSLKLEPLLKRIVLLVKLVTIVKMVALKCKSAHEVLIVPQALNFQLCVPKALTVHKKS